MNKLKKFVIQDYCGLRHLIKISITVIGILLIIIGIFGTLIPIIPGFLLILAGLILLGVEKKVIEKYITNYCKKFKKKLK